LHEDRHEISNAALISYIGSTTSSNSKDVAPQVGDDQAVAVFTNYVGSKKMPSQAGQLLDQRSS